LYGGTFLESRKLVLDWQETCKKAAKPLSCNIAMHGQMPFALTIATYKEENNK
jgi:hypothetical protein